jgi:hypothetical protein
LTDQGNRSCMPLHAGRAWPTSAHVIGSKNSTVQRPGVPVLFLSQFNRVASSAQTARRATVWISSSLPSSLPSYNGLYNSRIQSLYSDISRQKHSNSTTYNANIAWWHSTLAVRINRSENLSKKPGEHLPIQKIVYVCDSAACQCQPQYSRGAY